MNGIAELPRLLGIQLEDDDYAKPNLNGVMIGTILCPQSIAYADKFRRLLQRRLSVPTPFRFLTTNGWPIEINDERSIEVSKLVCSDVVKIQRHFDLPRLGIKWSDGNHLGFIFLKFNSCLTEVRKKILLDLGDRFMQEENDFEFLERHKWPVAQTQEKDLVVWDICHENYCIINKVDNKVIPGILNKVRKRPSKLSDKEPLSKQVRLKPNYNLNSIMISYVHDEATIHARNLKIELLNMGIDSVFLDVDDIPAGQDWQDVINTALDSCNTFVALVTPRYGETRWTNREAKLADDKEKLIIPISFLEKWPPNQLAVQFLSLQYIPWKTKEELSDEEDIASWDLSCVKRVAKEIRKLCTELEGRVSTPDSLSVLDSNNFEESSSMHLSPPPLCKKDNIVISEIQKDFVEKVTKVLNEEQLDDWLSIDMTDCNGDVVDSSCDNSLLNYSRDCRNKCYDTKKEKQSSDDCKTCYVTLDKIPTWKYQTASNLLTKIFPTWKNQTAEFKKNERLNNKVSIYAGNITTLVIDAIVNATDVVLSGGGGVDRAIHRAAGKELFNECKTLSCLKTGEAKITAGYKLPAKYVIHTTGPLGCERYLLEDCYKNSLFLALEKGVRSIAFPCIATGNFAFPRYEAAHVALRTVRCFLEMNESCVPYGLNQNDWSSIHLQHLFSTPDAVTKTVKKIYNYLFTEDQKKYVLNKYEDS